LELEIGNRGKKINEKVQEPVQNEKNNRDIKTRCKFLFKRRMT
jgi:hypothetical protein